MVEDFDEDDEPAAAAGPPEPTPDRPGRYRVVKRAALRATVALDSPVVGGLEVHSPWAVPLICWHPLSFSVETPVKIGRRVQKIDGTACV